MGSKLRVQKRLYYKIGEACKELGIQPYVLRYWETEFPALAPSKSRSGQRVYSEKELEIIRRIKTLLYDEGYTIAGAKKKLEGELASGTLGEPEQGELPPSAAIAAEAPAEPDSAAELPFTAPAPPPKIRPARPIRTAVAPEPTPPAALDSAGDERIQPLRSGIAKALEEAREILVLLDSSSR
jgi:DNA-binding transcriptional MerR regulator